SIVESLRAHEELTLELDPKTLEILNRRRRTAIVRRRGWLMRRMLLIADVVGLLVAMLLAEAVTWTHSARGTDLRTEVIVFILSIPFWVVAAKTYGLYERDEERTDHAGTDEFSGVFHMITVCTWIFFAGTYLTGSATRRCRSSSPSGRRRSRSTSPDARSRVPCAGAAST